MPKFLLRSDVWLLFNLLEAERILYDPWLLATGSMHIQRCDESRTPFGLHRQISWWFQYDELGRIIEGPCVDRD